MPATAPLRHPKECRRRKCNNGEIPHATLRNSICIFEEKVLAKNNGAHIIYVNAKIKDKETALGRLMHDLQCRTADEMFSEILAERVRELKETPKGVEDMCREMDEIYNEGIEIGETRGEQKAKKETVMTLASMGMPVNKISQAVKESMDQIQQWLAEGAATLK